MDKHESQSTHVELTYAELGALLRSLPLGRQGSEVDALRRKLKAGRLAIHDPWRMSAPMASTLAEVGAGQ